ncbi:glycosyl hydrolase 115 family protein [Gracilimonas mengyeensis]|uniref:glycosyl hydrolase 115 family protein n=1 Tax=Gracilimonas mengyeensis TaxID=1302730 RepID=UPI00163D696A|nr:glycosyl hydrolase 115 family protein [Gracilimonas mengyeensis]
MTWYIQPALAQFIIADEDEAASIVYDIQNTALDSITACLLAKDIEAVSGHRPEIYTTLEGVKGNVIVLGDITSDLIKGHFDTARLSGKWETYERVFESKPAGNIDQAMFIVGSDPRGMAYGVFDLSEEIGVSPWYWWADVPVQKQNQLSVETKNVHSHSPSVKYRGIFLNDEGWGLEPWASKTFETSVGNIGSKTYAKIFELLLRLKANMLWPAMHPNTVPFFQVPGNPEMAKKWEIAVGSSHAEAMLRNNVGEWDHETMGDFNYQTNRSTVYDYWEQRVKGSRGLDAIYTVGMRGVHDSGMEGADSMEEKVSALEKVISDQREMLKNHINEDVAEIPQSFTPYKEVLEIYESGMDVPEDVTITWPDDNFGHIRRFSNEAEQLREGGAGVYYHLSYLGSPHPYLLFSSISPAKVWREMKRAWLQNMDELWVGNVGDLKRREWEMEFFLGLAWNINSWDPDNIADYYEKVASRDISADHAEQISEIMWEYRRLSNERKPEHMGFNNPQWAGWPPIKDPKFSLWHYNDEVERRLQDYQNLRARATKIAKEIPEATADSYFELVYFPVAGAAALNEKILYAYKSREYAKQGRASANQYSDSAFAAYKELQNLTHRYNQEIAGGKWEHIVDESPGYEKGSSVFLEPITTRIKTDNVSGVGIAIEGQRNPLQPLTGNLPDAHTDESSIKLDISEAKTFGELKSGTDAEGSFVSWPDIGENRLIPGPGNYDTIPYEVDSPTKAVFEFNLEEAGGIHQLYLSVNHGNEDSDSWWVTVNDRAPTLVEGGVGSIQKLRAEEFVLREGDNTVIIHPRESGAKLYGIEFVQESRQITPAYTHENQLPTFNRFTQNQHFIDIFSRGEETEKWSAEASDSWIELSEKGGILNGNSHRIWVSVNYDEAPTGEDIEGYVEISSGDFLYRVELSVYNPDLNISDYAFAESNGVISIPANQYHQNKEGETAAWKPVKGLGRSGSAMLMEPMKGWYVEDLSQVKEQSPALEYEIVVTQGGSAEVLLEAVPAFPLQKSQPLRSAISVDDGAPQWINFEMNENWSEHVLEDRMTGTGRLELEPGTYRFKVWGTDPSVNIDRIIMDFGGLKPTYLGPSSSKMDLD